MALSLKRHNVSKCRFEIRKEEGIDGRCIALGPNALRVLDQIGVYEVIVKQG